MKLKEKRIAILGAGNIGCSIANGLDASGIFKKERIHLTRRKIENLEPYRQKGFQTSSDNIATVKQSDILIVCVEPHQLDALLLEISPELDPQRHLLISVVSGAMIKDMVQIVPDGLPVVRAMPNTAIAIGESMTCICADSTHQESIEITKAIFDTVGQTQVIREEQMTSATALCACGIAFFLRAIRAASQGGIEIGFHSHESLSMATQTAKGAAALLGAMHNHPEYEIDRVTTPKGCTISGLNQMEHGGFSSALIKGILTSAEKAEKLYKSDQ
ncbi:MAG: pyrroline-5-carboxylate reductase [Balneolaceae bacterium]